MIAWLLRRLRNRQAKRRLFVMHADDMALIHPETDWSHVCSRCGGKLGIYPSGIAIIERYPGIPLICNRCMTPDELLSLRPGPGALAERGTSVPNPNFK